MKNWCDQKGRTLLLISKTEKKIIEEMSENTLFFFSFQDYTHLYGVLCQWKKP